MTVWIEKFEKKISFEFIILHEIRSESNGENSDTKNAPKTQVWKMVYSILCKEVITKIEFATPSRRF